MLSEICLYLKNWFDWNLTKFYGHFTIESGQLNIQSEVQDGQYFRVIGSVFNDGVHKKGEKLKDESFDGAVWLMAIPQDVLDLADEIESWQGQYGGVNSQNMSPYQSESFGGYSYSKAGVSGSSGSSVQTWQSVFGARLRRYKKI